MASFISMSELQTVNDVQFGVIEKTPAQAAGTLVLLHGFTGSATSWGGLLDRLASSTEMRIIALDILGHGQASAPAQPERYTMQHTQEDILTLLQKRNVQASEAILLGYSMGGRIALYTAFSGFFRALILESASPGLAEEQARAERRKSDESLAQLLECEGIEPFVTYWEHLPLFASQQNLSPELWQIQRHQRLQNNPVGLANSLRGVGTGVQPALHEQLNQLRLPVLLITGELDSKYCTIARQMAERLPNATVSIIPQAGHSVHLERPEAFIQSVSTFCRSQWALSTKQ